MSSLCCDNVNLGPMLRRLFRSTSTAAEIIAPGRSGWTLPKQRYEARLGPKSDPIPYERNNYFGRDNVIGTDLQLLGEMMSRKVSGRGVLSDDELVDTIKKMIKEGSISCEEMETALLSEAALAEDWLSPEEDEAWKDL